MKNPAYITNQTTSSVALGLLACLGRGINPLQGQL
jgi:hypothetical protein